MEYLFTAHYNDGTSYQQNIEDKSILEPEKRSCFYDIQHDKLIKFELTNGKDYYNVNLLNGEIRCNINGQLIQFVNNTKNLTNYRIIYYRGNEVAINYAFDGGKRNRIANYTIGWQAINENGENIQNKIVITV
jgi:hypothetical protein